MKPTIEMYIQALKDAKMPYINNPEQMRMAIKEFQFHLDNDVAGAIEALETLKAMKR